MPLTENEIRQRLLPAEDGFGHPSIGYSELDAIPAAALKCAAVLILLIWHEDDWHILYTRRTDRVESHKGQVSFPGGACDADESTPAQTALREAHEEIGVDPSSVHVLGLLHGLITITSFRVTPVIGVLEWPAVFRLGEDEVERVFTIPLGWLADPTNRWELPYPGRDRGVIVFHPFDGELVWGATARMTVDLIDSLGM